MENVHGLACVEVEEVGHSPPYHLIIHRVRLGHRRSPCPVAAPLLGRSPGLGSCLGGLRRAPQSSSSALAFAGSFQHPPWFATLTCFLTMLPNSMASLEGTYIHACSQSPTHPWVQFRNFLTPARGPQSNVFCIKYTIFYASCATCKCCAPVVLYHLLIMLSWHELSHSLRT